MEKTTILFTGDSITEASRNLNDIENLNNNSLGNGFSNVIAGELIACNPDKNFKFYNTGIKGNSSTDLIKRFDNDVIKYNPNIVTLCIGVGDVLRKYNNSGLEPVDCETYKKNLKIMINKLKEINAHIILLSPYVIDKDNNSKKFLDIQKHVEMCQDIATEYNLDYINLQNVFYNYLQHLDNTMLSSDSVHPNIVGHTIISKLILEKLEKII